MNLSSVEKYALKNSPFKSIYPPDEKINTIVVDNFPALGKLAALRFVEWVQQNPQGVISLPTGKTPEHFIKWVKHMRANWHEPEVQQLLVENGIDAKKKPEMRGLHFVQIDEFYPIDPAQHNSFHDYVKKYYIDGFGLDSEKALLIDCSQIGVSGIDELNAVWPEGEVDLSLRNRSGKTSLERKQKMTIERIDQWCLGYEERIRQLGGIGFFLGGIGPDGHVGFNVRGSDHFSTSRLTPTNYETQAAAASDLGGIEVSRKRLVITIGLGTICFNPECSALIIAAGEAKAEIVRAAIESEKDILYPATALHSLKNARFYITLGAAKLLGKRQLVLIEAQQEIDDATSEKIVVDIAIKTRKSIKELDEQDFKNDPAGSLLLEKRNEGLHIITNNVYNSIESKLIKGACSRQNTRFLHTEPHHDDLMLGYLPHIVRHVRRSSNVHYFACLTSGFTAVTNAYMKNALIQSRRFLTLSTYKTLMQEDYFKSDNFIGRNRDVWQYLDGVAENNESKKDHGISRRMVRNLMDTFDLTTTEQVADKIDSLMAYFDSCYPGQKDEATIQTLKGMSREWEAETLWGYFGWNCENVKHLRLGFYTGDIFTEEPTMNRDVPPVLELLESTKPDVVTVALDPEASGPDTHYKVLQAITEALRQYVDKTGNTHIKVWGYRNVWFRFHPSEANLFVPVSLNMFAIMEKSFSNTFISQKNASFPSYEHDGPFSELAQKIQVEQYQCIKKCLGRSWFYEHGSALIRATRGLVYLKEMTLDEFYATSRELRKAAENR